MLKKALIMKIDTRAIITLNLHIMTFVVLIMMYVKPEIANVDLFKSIAQAIVIQGFIGLALSFYFTAQLNPRTPPAE
jgi:hypothetical protein